MLSAKEATGDNIVAGRRFHLAEIEELSNHQLNGSPVLRAASEGQPAQDQACRDPYSAGLGMPPAG